MWLRYTGRDLRSVSYYLGVVLVAEAAAMLVPFLVGLFSFEWVPAQRYLFWAGVTASVGTALRLVRVYPEGLTRQQAIMLSGIAWICVALIGAVPLWQSGHFSSYLNAAFDSFAAFTTTNVSVMSDLDHLSYADNAWRFVMALSGGLAVVTMGLTMGDADMRNVSDPRYEQGAERILPRAFKSLNIVCKAMGAAIAAFGALQVALLVAKGMYGPHALFHGLALAMSAATTSGISPMAGGIAYYHSWGVEVLLMVSSLIACVNLLLRVRAVRGDVKPLVEDTATHTALLWWSMLLTVLSASFAFASMADGADVMATSGLFEFVSAATTSGFSVINTVYHPEVVTSGALLTLSIVTAIGASMGSTSGGIHLERLAIVTKAVLGTMRDAVSPDSSRRVVTVQHMGRRVVSEQQITGSMLMFVLFIAMYTVGALMGVAYGYDAVSALSQSITMASNAGLSTGVDLATAPDPLKLVYIGEMWLGRLGVVSMLGFLMKLGVSMGFGTRRGVRRWRRA